MNTVPGFILLILSGAVILGCVTWCFGQIVAAVMNHMEDKEEEEKEKAD